MRFHATTPSVEKALAAHGMTIGTAAEVGDLVLLSGWVGVDLETGAVVEGDIETSTRATIATIEAVLGDLDLTLDNVVKLTAYLVDPADFGGFGTVFDELFGAPRPLRTTVIAGLLAGKLELDVIASREPRTRA